MHFKDEENKEQRWALTHSRSPSGCWTCYHHGCDGPRLPPPSFPRRSHPSCVRETQYPRYSSSFTFLSQSWFTITHTLVRLTPNMFSHVRSPGLERASQNLSLSSDWGHCSVDGGSTTHSSRGGCGADLLLSKSELRSPNGELQLSLIFSFQKVSTC